MKLKRVTFVYPNEFRIVTGGHRYEEDFIRNLTDCLEFSTEVIYQHKERLRGWRKVLSPLSNLALLRRLKDSDLTIFNSTKGFYYLPLCFILGRLLRRKTMIIHHHFLQDEFSGFKRLRYKLMENLFLKSAGCVMTPSPYISDQLKDRLGIDPAYCPIPFDSATVLQDDQPQEVTPGKLLYVGTIERRKGLYYLLEALKELDRIGNGYIDYSLHIAGKVVEEDYFGSLKEVISRYGLKVEFHGFLQQDELAGLYATSDIFLFPSQLEGFGMSMNEAMKYGLPVIAFDNSAMPYTVDESNGILVLNRDSRQFGQSIGELITNRNLRNKLSRGAKASADSLPTHEDFRSTSIAIITTLLSTD